MMAGVEDRRTAHARVEAQGPVRIITMSLPARLNSFNTFLMEDTAEALRASFEDESVKAVILTGAGRAFSAGWDRQEAAEIMTMPEGASKEERKDRWVRAMYGMFDELRGARKPLITAINGPAVGGGMSIAFTGHLRVASCDAYFKEVTLQIGADAEGTVHTGAHGMFGTLADIERIGPVIYNELALGVRMPASRLYEVGLLNRVVPTAELLTAALEYARHVSTFSIESLTKLRSYVQSTWVPAPYSQERDESIEATKAQLFTPEAEEAAKAFLAGARVGQ